MVPVDGAAAAAAAAAAVAAVESDPSNQVEEEGDEFAAYCRRGRGRRRVEMEDRHVAKVALGGDPQVALFAVFDGHGGKNATEFAAQNMPKFMAEELRKVDRGDSDEIEGAVKKCYLKTDEEFLKREESGGACCVTALLQKGGLTVSNTGDCRAVLSRAGTAEALTSDHRASREDERERIENLGKRSRGGSCSAWGDGSGKKRKSGDGGSRSLRIVGQSLPSAPQHRRYGGPGSGATTASGAPWTARRLAPAFGSSGAKPYI